MTESKLEKLGPLMNEIGAEAAEIVGGDPDGLYIFAEVEPRNDLQRRVQG